MPLLVSTRKKTKDAQMTASAMTLNRNRTRLSRQDLYKSITIRSVRSPRVHASRFALYRLEKDFAQADRNDIHRNCIHAPSLCGDGVGVTTHEHRELSVRAPNAPNAWHSELVDRSIRREAKCHSAIVL